MELRRRIQPATHRPAPWQMKPLGSAVTSFIKEKNGLLTLTISHDVVRGVTPGMLAWWFQNLGESMSFNGEAYPRYLVWHPVDHIHWELVRHGPGGSTGQGAYFRIVEAFGARPEHYIDSVEYVEKCDEEGLSLVRRVMGVEVFRLEHRFTEVPGGTQYDSRMSIGCSVPILDIIFNYLVRPLVFSDRSGVAWLQHNIEEVGNFEIFLPELYRACCPAHSVVEGNGN